MTQQYQYWTDKEIYDLKKYYPTLDVKTLRQQYFPNRTVGSLRTFANKTLGLKQTIPRVGRISQIYCDDDFFNTPTVINSYWAGYIAGDGNIALPNSLSFCCTSRDVEILEAFKIATNSDHKIKYRDRKLNGKTHNMSELIINGRKNWINNLNIHWNIGAKKSFTLQPPNLTDIDHIRAYIIGLTDADGSVFHYQVKKRPDWNPIFYFAWVGTFEILSWLREQLKILCPNFTFTNQIVKRRGCYGYVLTSKKAREVHIALKNSVNLPYKLSRKWDIEY